MAKETAGQEVIRELDNWITKPGGLVMMRGPLTQEEYERQGQQSRIVTIEERDLIPVETQRETMNFEMDLGRLKQKWIFLECLEIRVSFPGIHKVLFRCFKRLSRSRDGVAKRRIESHKPKARNHAHRSS